MRSTEVVASVSRLVEAFVSTAAAPSSIPKTRKGGGTEDDKIWGGE